MPWSFVLELHGWWHIFTGIGAYTCLSLLHPPMCTSSQPHPQTPSFPVPRSLPTLPTPSLADPLAVIALVEYLTSASEADTAAPSAEPSEQQLLRSRFAWPSSRFVTGGGAEKKVAADGGGGETDPLLRRTGDHQRED